jgi:hypothetical protein
MMFAPQAVENRSIGRWHRKSEQRLDVEPLPRCHFETLRLASRPTAAVDQENDLLRRIRVDVMTHGENVADVDLDAQLLGQFAAQRGDRRLSRLDLTARKLPSVGQVSPSGPTADQKSTGHRALDEPSHDEDSAVQGVSA